MRPSHRLLRHGPAAPLLALAALLPLAGCETGPAERKVRAEFACDDGRKLRAVFFQDRRTAELRLSRKEAVEIPAVPGVPGRAFEGGVISSALSPMPWRDQPPPSKARPGTPGTAFEGGGWSLHGIGDSAELITPSSPPTRCVETR